MNVVLCGASGNMGREMMALFGEREYVKVVAAVDKNLPCLECACYAALEDVKEDADVVVDFSHHDATRSLLKFAVSRKIPLVIATTGQSEEELQSIRAASEIIPVFLSGNMSMGIALLSEMAKKTASVFPFADIEIVESHHSQKSDVPSGTALMLAKSIGEVRKSHMLIGRHKNGRRKEGEIGISSLRLGCDIGTHSVIFDTGCERITLRHQANSRALYADGALQAMNFIITKDKGLFGIKDLFV